MSNIIYSQYFSKSDRFNQLRNEGIIVNTPYRGAPSPNSYCLKTTITPSNTKEYKDHVKAIIKDIFGISDIIFDEKYQKAINGAGQEWNEINRLHSSALVPLLFFYNVSETNPLTLSIDGKNCIFTKSEFEVDNYIGKNRINKDFYSHIDVLLIGKCEDKTISLYLESKFGEYINQRGDEKGIPRIKEYDEIYSNLINKVEGINFIFNEKSIDIIQINKKPYSLYCQGIRQMVCHYLGMKNRQDNCDLSYLGEILFDFRPYINTPDYFEMYESIHGKLIEALNSISNPNNSFKLLPKVLSYQDILKSFDINSAISKLYI